MRTLDELRDYRNKADYDLADPSQESPRGAQFALTKAEEVVQVLAIQFDEPRKSALRTCVHAYLQSCGDIPRDTGQAR
jgi:hypothetical protein